MNPLHAIDGWLSGQADAVVAWAWDHHEISHLRIYHWVTASMVVTQVADDIVNRRGIGVWMVTGWLITIFILGITEVMMRLAPKARNTLMRQVRTDRVYCSIRPSFCILAVAFCLGFDVDHAGDNLRVAIHTIMETNGVAWLFLTGAYTPEGPGGTKRRHWSTHLVPEGA